MAILEKYALKYEEELKEKIHLPSIDKELLLAIMKSCGPSLFKKDSSTVATSNRKELDQVKKAFLINKLGLKDGEYLEHAIQSVIQQMGKSNRNKYRAVFYYLLVKHFNAKSTILKKDKSSKTQDSDSIDKLADFGVSLIQSQENIDPEIRLATEENFSDLLL